MEQCITNNNRIAKNTFLLYIRMLVVMGVNLFTSRIILIALGVTDFGIYNVVGGLSSSFVFFSSALTNSTQRFLNFQLGRNSKNQVNNVFNLNLLIYSTIALCVVIIGFTIGSWIVKTQLIIPADKLHAAIIVLYTMVISLGLTFIFSVYESVLIARENMKIYAYFSIFDALAKLGIAYCIIYVENKLVIYAILMVIIQLIPKTAIVIYCTKIYQECKLKFYWDKNLFKEMLVFAGWNIYGSGVWMINEQGISILLNIFFGPVVNAARGIAVQVNNTVNNFSTNFFVAVRPQLIKRYAARETRSMISLIYSSSRFSFYLLWILCLPLTLRTDYVLKIWLKIVPEYATSFVQWILIYSMINVLNNPIWTALSATGNLKRTVMIGSNLFLLAFPASYMAIKMGADPVIVYPLLTLGRVAFLLVSIINLKKYIDISIYQYIKHVISPITLCVIPVSIFIYYINMLLPETFTGFACITIISSVLCLIAIYWVGITKNERLLCLCKVSRIIKIITKCRS